MTLDLDELERLEREATQPEWKHWAREDVRWDDPMSCGYDSRESHRGTPYYCTGPRAGTSEQASADAALIAALRNAAPALLAAARERDRLTADLAEMQQNAARIAETLGIVAAERDTLRADLAAAREREARLHRLAWAATRVVEGWGDDADRIENNEQARRCDELEAAVRALTAATGGERSEGGTP